MLNLLKLTEDPQKTPPEDSRSGRFTIELRNLRFFARHGLYEEERKTGNEFEVDVSLEYAAPGALVLTIDQTINYAEVFRIVREEFAKDRDLLETCAMELADRLEQAFPQLDRLKISIRKLHPPISHFSGSVGIEYSRVIR